MPELAPDPAPPRPTLDCGVGGAVVAVDVDADELGFVPFDREGDEMHFSLLSARHGCSSTVITSNLAFSEWPRVFGGDEKLTAVVLDRLAENAVVFTTKGQSYRQRKRR